MRLLKSLLGILLAALLVSGSDAFASAPPSAYYNNVHLLAVPAPGASSLTQVAGGTLAATTYYVRVTETTANGETTGSTEQSVAVSINNVLVVTVPVFSNPAVTGANIYVSTSSGTETLQATGITSGAPWTEPTTGLVSGAALPTTNTANGSIIGGYLAPTVAPVAATSPITVSAPSVGQQTISCPTCSTSSSTVTSVTASAPLTSSGGTTPNIALTNPLAVGYGGTGTASPGLTAGNGLTVSGSFPTQQFVLNTPVSIANGGTGSTTAAIAATSPVTVSGTFPNQTLACGSCVTGLTAGANIAVGTGVTPSVALSGLVPIANGGTGSASAATAATSPITVSGSFPNQTLACATCVTNVTASGNLASSGGTTPAITMSATPSFTGATISGLSSPLVWSAGVGYLETTDASANAYFILNNNGKSGNPIVYFQTAGTNESTIDADGTYHPGSSTYGPTGATVNGLLKFNGALNSNNVNTLAGLYTLLSVSNGFGVNASGGQAENDIYAGNSSEGLTAGIACFYYNSGSAAVLSSCINRNGTFTTGSSTYGPTSATVNGALTATNVQAESNGSTLSYLPPVYTAAGAAVASTVHTVAFNASLTLSTSCVAGALCGPSGFQTFAGAAIFAATSSYTCVADSYGATGGFGLVLTLFNNSTTQVNYEIYNGTGTTLASGTVYTFNVICTGT